MLSRCKHFWLGSSLLCLLLPPQKTVSNRRTRVCVSPAHLCMSAHVGQHVSALCKPSGTRGGYRSLFHRPSPSGCVRRAARACQEPVLLTEAGQAAEAPSSRRSIASGRAGGCHAWAHAGAVCKQGAAGHRILLQGARLLQQDSRQGAP